MSCYSSVSNLNEDKELEQNFATQPEKYFQLVYDRYSGPLFRLLYRFTMNSESSEEILQDLFIELHTGKYKFSENGSLKSWLFTVAKNRGINHHKKNSKLRANTDELIDQKNIESQLIDKDIHLKLSKAELKLPQELQETWNLRKSGLDYQEIAHKLSIPIGTVKSRFSRLVEYLKKEFEV
jgi:RNA polymerase sigma factor (sigma-70 family)